MVMVEFSLVFDGEIAPAAIESWFPVGPLEMLPFLRSRESVMAQICDKHRVKRVQDRKLTSTLICLANSRRSKCGTLSRLR